MHSSLLSEYVMVIYCKGLRARNIADWVMGEVRYPVHPTISTFSKPAFSISLVISSGTTVPVTQSCTVPSLSMS